MLFLCQFSKKFRFIACLCDNFTNIPTKDRPKLSELGLVSMSNANTVQLNYRGQHSAQCCRAKGVSLQLENTVKLIFFYFVSCFKVSLAFRARTLGKEETANACGYRAQSIRVFLRPLNAI